VIPTEVWKEPYMTVGELKEELERGVEFYGWFENGVLVGVMGIQPVKDVTLIRHAYVLTSNQRKGIGEKLLKHLLGLAQTKDVLVGTWAAAWWAVQFYQKNGFRLVPLESRNKLRQHWSIPDRQAETSVVLKLEK
jgi:GNAT superfamily N-acetyltransferase